VPVAGAPPTRAERCLFLLIVDVENLQSQYVPDAKGCYLFSWSKFIVLCWFIYIVEITNTLRHFLAAAGARITPGCTRARKECPVPRRVWSDEKMERVAQEAARCAADRSAVVITPQPGVERAKPESDTPLKADLPLGTTPRTQKSEHASKPPRGGLGQQQFGVVLLGQLTRDCQAQSDTGCPAARGTSPAARRVRIRPRVGPAEFPAHDRVSVQDLDFAVKKLFGRHLGRTAMIDGRFQQVGETKPRKRLGVARFDFMAGVYSTRAAAHPPSAASCHHAFEQRIQHQSTKAPRPDCPREKSRPCRTRGLAFDRGGSSINRLRMRNVPQLFRAFKRKRVSGVLKVNV